MLTGDSEAPESEIKTRLSGLGTNLADRLSITYLETKLSLAMHQLDGR